MTRVWDVMVGLTMIMLSLAFQVIFFGLVVMTVLYAIGSWWGSQLPRWAVIMVLVATLISINAAAFYDYRRGAVKSAIAGKSGRIHLLPRGFDRMMNGREIMPVASEFAESTQSHRPSPVSSRHSFMIASILMIISVGLVIIGVNSRSEISLVGTGLGFILFVVSIAFFIQSALIYVGVMRSK